MADKIKMRRGELSDLPNLDEGEFGLATDVGSVYIGNPDGNGNVLINPIKEHIDGYSIDGYLLPAVDNVHGLGSPDLRWKNITVGPESLHLVSRASETNGTAYTWSIGIDNDGNLTLGESGTVSLVVFPSGGSTTTFDRLLVADGYEAFPSFSFTNSSGVGLYLSALNELSISTNSIRRTTIDSNGKFWIVGDGYVGGDLYFNGALEPVNGDGYFNGNLQVNGDGYFNENLLVGEKLQFSGTTNAFPALKRYGAGLELRLADDSGQSSLITYSVYGSGTLRAGSTGSIHWRDRTRINSGADGNLQLSNDAITDFGLLQFGGATNAFPALKRNGAGLEIRLADDSDYASVACKNIIVDGEIANVILQTALDGYALVTTENQRWIDSSQQRQDIRDALDGYTGGGGDVTKVGTPVDNQIGVWTGDGTIEGTSGLTFDGDLRIVKIANSPIITIDTFSTTDIDWGLLQFRKSDSAAETILQTDSGDNLGGFVFKGVNSSSAYATAALIGARQSDASGATYIPGIIDFYTSDGTSAIAERVRITSIGRVGVGTDTPLKQLHVNVNTTLTADWDGVGYYSRTTSNDMTDVFGTAHCFGIEDDTSGLQLIGCTGFVRDGADDSGKFFVAVKNAGVFNYPGNPGALGDFVINKSGYVGIGTDTPGGKLHVSAGNIYPVGRFERNTTDTNLSRSVMSMKHTTSADMVNGFGCGFVFEIEDSAAVNNLIAVLNAERDGADNSGAFVFDLFQSGLSYERMRITSTGNVGIGTDTPVTKLHVQGDGYFNENLLVGEKLQFSGTTNAFPALKRYGAGLELRLADDSGQSSLITYSVYGSGNIRAGDTMSFYWNNRSQIRSPVDGNIKLNDASETTFNLLQFGGTTNAFPALKRNGAGLEIRLADDSDYASVACNTLDVYGGIQVVGDGYFHDSVCVVGQIYQGSIPTYLPGGTTQIIDWNNGNVAILDLEDAYGDVTVTLSNPRVGATYIIKIIQDSTTPLDIIWPETVLWPGGTEPVISTGAGAIDVITLLYDGTNYLAKFRQDYS